MEQTATYLEPDVAQLGRDRQRRTATLIALTLACAAEAWTTSAISLTLTDLTGTLSASSDEASWALTAYTTAFAISIALSHRISLTLGNRRYLASCSLAYVVSLLGCVSSYGLPAFLFFRVLGGFAGGAFLVRTFVFLSQKYDATTRTIPSVFFAILYFSLGRVISPVLSGWFADTTSWRYALIPGVFLMLAAAWLFFANTDEHWTANEKDRSFDFIGAMLLIIGAVSVQVVLSRGEIDGWLESTTLTALLGIGIASNLALTAWQLHPSNLNPLLDLSFLRDRSVSAGGILGFALGVLLGGSLYVVPQYLRIIETHSALQTGMLLSVGGIASVLVLCGFRYVIALMTRIGGAGILMMALLAEAASQYLFSHFFTPSTPDHLLLLPLAFNGIFIALSVPTLGIVAFAQVDNREVSSARSMYYGFRQLGASFGVTLAAATVDRRMFHHSARLLDSIASQDQVITGSDRIANLTLALMVRRQASVLSYADVFLLMTIIAIVALPWTLLLPRPITPRPSGVLAQTN